MAWLRATVRPRRSRPDGWPLSGGARPCQPGGRASLPCVAGRAFLGGRCCPGPAPPGRKRGRLPRWQRRALSQGGGVRRTEPGTLVRLVCVVAQCNPLSRSPAEAYDKGRPLRPPAGATQTVREDGPPRESSRCAECRFRCVGAQRNESLLELSTGKTGYACGLNTTMPRGGTVTFSKYCRPCQEKGAACTPPMLPWPLPP